MNDDYLKLPLKRESQYIEYKENSSKLSKDMWESLSAFENTNGGVIYLGINENSGEYSATGVKKSRVVSVIDEFRSTINNGKINFCTVSNDDIRVLSIHGNEDRKVIKIIVNEAPDSRKPIYLDSNLSRTFIRENSIDRKANLEELKRFIRNSSVEQNDSMVITGTDISDLNMDDVDSYINRLKSLKKHLDVRDKKKVLKSLNVISKDENGQYALTAGGLLFFGNNSSIIKYFNGFQLEYYDKSDPLQKRWSNRISSLLDDLNIYSFFNEVQESLYATIKDGFKLNSMEQRINSKPLMKEVLREGLINMLMHADYYDGKQSVLTIYDKYYNFENPGKMLVSSKDFFDTSKTRARNSIISKLFIKIGFGERAGSGGETIRDNTAEMKYERPMIESKDGITTLKVWCVDYASSIGDNNITSRQREILKSITKDPLFSLSRKEIEEATGLSRRIVNDELHALENKKLIERVGRGRATKYSLPQSDERIISKMEALPEIMRHIIENQND